VSIVRPVVLVAAMKDETSLNCSSSKIAFHSAPCSRLFFVLPLLSTLLCFEFVLLPLLKMKFKQYGHVNEERSGKPDPANQT
jgi:hypothetical protein